MPRVLFGTDGIRGVAGRYPLDRPTVHAVGVALGEWSRHRSDQPEIVIGMDTRESGPWIAAALAAGLARSGVRARFAGVITTPGVAFLTRMDSFVAGVMISASHNPFQDNGIKVFDHSGSKLPDREEEALEAVVLRLCAEGMEPRQHDLEAEKLLGDRYLDFLVSTFPGSLDGLKIVLDCAHGAASRLAPRLFRRLGAEVHAIACRPTGRNINLRCGALHPQRLQAKVVELGAAAGFAFDGDADRLIAVSPSGRIVDGDSTLLLAARYLKSRGLLHSNAVVATVMSNLGFQKALEAEGIALIRTPVGDKYVLEEMVRRQASLGGEQSGHVIFLDQATTGDGLLTALRLLEVLQATGRPLDPAFKSYPQTLLNIRVAQKKPLAGLPAVNAAIRAAELALGSEGRVLVRFSGTEPLVRVMVEGPTSEIVDAHVHRIAAAIRSELGACDTL